MQHHRFKTIAEFHQYRGLSKPAHPLISVIDLTIAQRMPPGEVSLIKDFYSISLKRNFPGRLKYGQQHYDFDDGTMFFMAPGQVFRLEIENEEEVLVHQSGWMLLIHPDFLWNTPLAKTIRQYEYFSYAVHEALHVSEKEEAVLSALVKNIVNEYESNIDKFSQDVIIAQLELLLTYSERFYHRQFITRKISNHQLLGRMEEILNNYFDTDELLKNGLPTVQYVADSLNVSPNYLSGLLKILTGQSTQHHIHDKLMEKAKEKLSTTNLSVSEIAYGLGFEHPQSFSKLFKTKTNFSPLEFRESFN